MQSGFPNLSAGDHPDVSGCLRVNSHGRLQKDYVALNPDLSGQSEIGVTIFKPNRTYAAGS